jgi:biopolymer transport protein ExbD
MGAKLGSSGGPMAEINVTPLIDVVLVLLVVFMVITPMLESGKNVDLPVATQAVTVNDVGQHVVVSITADGKWWVEQDEVTEDSLVDAVNAEFNMREASTVLVKGARDLEYQQVRKLMDLLAENRMTSLLVATAKEQ